MKTRYLTLALFLLWSGHLMAQVEYVLNGSFENFTTCPTGGITYRGVPLSSQGTLPYVFNPTIETPDWCHRCMGGDAEDKADDQPPRTGDGYVGFVHLDAYNAINDPNTTVFRKEYIQGYLQCPLQAGKTYTLSLWVKRHRGFKWATDHLTMVVHQNQQLTSNGPQGGVGEYLTLTPAQQATSISNPVGNMFTDDDNWVQMTGTIVANGGERWWSIGHFEPNLGLVNYQVVCWPGCETGTYLLIDDVSVTGPGSGCDPFALIENTTYSAGSNTNITVGEFIRSGYNVSNPSLNGNVLVEPGAQVDYIAGKYIDLEHGFSAESGAENHFQACVIPNVCESAPYVDVTLGPDIDVHCDDEPFLIGDDCSELTYQWYADPPVALNFLSDPTNCITEVDIPNDFWTSGYTTITYTLAVNEDFCDANFDDIVINLVPATPPNAEAGPDHHLNHYPDCLPYAQLGTPAQQGVSYSWSPTTGLDDPNLAQPTHTYDEWNPASYPIVFTVTATWDNGCGSATDQVVVDAAPHAYVYDVSTGYSNGSLLPMNVYGKVDDHWVYTLQGDGTVPFNNELKIVDAQYYNLANDGWASIHPDKSHWINPSGNIAMNLPDDPDYDYTFTRYFDVLDPSAMNDVKLQINHLAVDNACIIKVNGQKIFPSGSQQWPEPLPLNNSDAFDDFSIQYGQLLPQGLLVQGTNEVSVHIANHMATFYDPEGSSRIGLKMWADLVYKSCAGPMIKTPVKPGGDDGGERRNALITSEGTTIAQVFPNPSQRIFYLVPGEFGESGYSIIVTDMLGNVVLDRSGLQDPQFEIDLAGQAAGLYNIQLNVDDRTEVLRIVKQTE